MGSLLDDICKKLEGASILSDQDQVFGYVDSGSHALNKIISGDAEKGYPIGSITEIYGESSTAKTVFLTHAFIGAQKRGYYTVMIDNEHAYSPSFAKILGVDADRLLYFQPETLEDCFETIESTIKAIREQDTDTPILIGYDSIGVSPTRKEMADEFGKNSEMGGALRAKVAGQCLRRINPMLRKYKAGLIIINQVRSKVGVMFGDPRTRAGGGKALLYYCGTSLEAASGKNDVLYDKMINPAGITGTIKTDKNKITKPFQECTFELLYDKGLTKGHGLCDLYYKEGTVTSPTKGWYSLDDGKTKHRKAEIDKTLMERFTNE